ncbi:MAG: metallophosphoesterase family protein [Bryobacteraceae bacterium]
MKLAVFADIHANVWALEAVLADATERGVTAFLNLGDVLYGPLRPRETYERLMNVSFAATVQGNQDRQICETTASESSANPTLAYVVSDLGREPVKWLQELAPTARFGDGVFLCHGTPTSDTTYLLEDVDSGHPMVRPAASILALLGGVTEPVVLCGHTHIPRLVELPDGRIIVNPGSVGLPAYADESPVRHVMETYSPHASYAIVERGERGWGVSFHRVAYDHGQAARAAESHGREDWARALRTGWMTGPAG